MTVKDFLVLPRWWVVSTFVAIGLLGLAGGLSVVSELEYRYHPVCEPVYDEQGSFVREDCSRQSEPNIWFLIIRGIERALYGPSIAIVVLNGVYLLANAIVTSRRLKQD